jgi:hypothetical protein
MPNVSLFLITSASFPSYNPAFIIWSISGGSLPFIAISRAITLLSSGPTTRKHSNRYYGGDRKDYSSAFYRPFHASAHYHA